MPDTSTIWMNVTTSATWDRPAVGIVRVEQQLFQALRERLGSRLQACIISDGKFVHYDGYVGSVKAEAARRVVEEDFVWPDPSFDDPAPVRGAAHEAHTIASWQRRHSSVNGSRPVEFAFGDTLLSVGLDWNWEDQRLDTLMYELKRDVA